MENKQKISMDKKDAEKFLIMPEDYEKVQRTLILAEPLLRALLYGHLLFACDMFHNFGNEIEDVTFDKEKKQVTILFKKEGNKK